MADLPSNQRLTFNVNEYVRVRLTERGRECLRKNHAKFWADHGKPPAYQPPGESDGWSRWQLWELASEFGEHMYNGCEAPFETEIELERPVSETAREHPPELMAVVDKWQDCANALRKGQLPGYSTQYRAIDALLADVRRAVAPHEAKTPQCEHEWMEVAGKRGVYKPSWFCPKCWHGQRERPASLAVKTSSDAPL